MKAAYWILLLFLLFLSCQTRLIRQEEIPLINEYYEDRVFSLKNKLRLDNKTSLRKGAKVKIWVESLPSLLKIKCYPANQKRETALGRMVAYQLAQEFKGKDYTIEDLEKLIYSNLEDSAGGTFSEEDIVKDEVRLSQPSEKKEKKGSKTKNKTGRKRKKR
ncbi:MAG: type II secretion system-associated lipoprotein [Leptospiraceae bacterium]|nr:type II secretion system-associated lipoprotein [Leptospiraceae bacterium]MCP5502761.1 type II secretion system-associated lipoprotein [Leptospiraceae bacterium]